MPWPVLDYRTHYSPRLSVFCKRLAPVPTRRRTPFFTLGEPALAKRIIKFIIMIARRLRAGEGIAFDERHNPDGGCSACLFAWNCRAWQHWFHWYQYASSRGTLNKTGTAF